MQNLKISYIISVILLFAAFFLLLNFFMGVLGRGAVEDITLLQDTDENTESEDLTEEEPILLNNTALAEADYFFAVPNNTYSSNFRVFFDPWEEVEIEEVIEEPVVTRGPRTSRDLKFLGTLSQNGNTAYSFRDNRIDTAGIFTIGSQWRGWTLLEVRENDFIFTKDGEEYIVQR
jgi:hypothetical protein